MKHYGLPGPDMGGLKSFPYRLAADEKGAPMIVSDDVIRMYLGYCVQCKIEQSTPKDFHRWLYSTDAEESTPALEATVEADSQAQNNLVT